MVGGIEKVDASTRERARSLPHAWAVGGSLQLLGGEPLGLLYPGHQVLIDEGQYRLHERKLQLIELPPAMLGTLFRPSIRIFPV